MKRSTRRATVLGLCGTFAIVPILGLIHHGSASAPRGGVTVVARPAAADLREVASRASRSYSRFDQPIDAAAVGPAVPLVATPETTTSTLARVPLPAAPTTIAVFHPRPRPTTTTTPTTRPRPRPTTTTTTTTPPPPAHSETGGASWYDAPAGTCANNDAPMGTVLTVTALSTGKSVTCQVTSRGPSVSGRIVDLARSTFAQLADPSMGVIQVRVTW